MKAKIFLSLFFFAVFMLNHPSVAQIPNCDSLVPVVNIDFSLATSDSTWHSSFIWRNGNCCTSIPPYKCVLFAITVGVNTVALALDVNCPVVSGSIYYQVDCGTLIPAGDTASISSPGIYYLTFCKVGNEACTYAITSLTQPVITGINESEDFKPALHCDILGNHFFDINLSTPASFTLNIFSADGKKISEKNYSLSSGDHQIPVYTHELDAGIYFYSIAGDRINKTFKFIK